MSISLYDILYAVHLLCKLYTLKNKTKQFRALSFSCNFHKKLFKWISRDCTCNTMRKNLVNTGLNSIRFAYEFDSDSSDCRLISTLMSRNFMYKIKIGRAKNVCVVVEKNVCY